MYGAKVPEGMRATERHEDYYENTVIRSLCVTIQSHVKLRSANACIPADKH